MRDDEKTLSISPPQVGIHKSKAEGFKQLVNDTYN
jgi:hypothetical protein